MGARPRPAELPDWAELPPPPPLPPRAGALESCVKATPGPQSRSPARPTGCGTSSLLSTLGKGTRLARAPAIRGKGVGGAARRLRREDKRVISRRASNPSRYPLIPAAPPAKSGREHPAPASRARHDPSARTPQSPQPRPASLRLNPTPP